MKTKKTKPLKQRSGHPPMILSKSGAMRDRTKFTRKTKHKGEAL